MKFNYHYFFLIIMVLFCISFTKKDTNHEKKASIILVSDSMGYYYPDKGLNLEKMDILPRLEIAFEVAIPILRGKYGSSIGTWQYEGYLKDGKIWVIYGQMPMCEGGFPYIELNKHDGKVVKIAHFK